MRPQLVLKLKRLYHAEGVNGVLSVFNQEICKCIELPWLGNQCSISCIPEGEYALVIHWNRKFGRVLQFVQVPQRTHILIHPANEALRELRGCIAPVMSWTGPGKGIQSIRAMQQLMKIVDYYLLKSAELSIQITSSHSG